MREKPPVTINEHAVMPDGVLLAETLGILDLPAVTFVDHPQHDLDQRRLGRVTFASLSRLRLS